jgi:alpha-tubulin suppressor-like RCC1 family protein
MKVEIRLATLAFAAVLLGACATKIGGNNAAGLEGRPCASDRDCPQPANPCQMWTCWQEVCTPVAAAQDTVLPDAAQTAGDCKLLVCDGQGKATALADRTDPPAEDDNPCAEEACQDDKPTFPPVTAGAPCGKAGVCTGYGKCGECLPAAQRCKANTPETCSDEGAWESPGPCPEGEPVCKGTACIGVSEVVAGRGFTCARLADGTVRCFGDPGGNRLGQDGGRRVRGLDGVVQVAAGGAHTCALLGDQTVRCWGDGASGQLGDGEPGRGWPAAVPGLAKATQIAAGGRFSCARTEDGTAVCWGDNEYGQIGASPAKRKGPVRQEIAPGASAQDRPTEVEGLAAAVQLSLGGAHACARLANGGVVCWGSDSDGQLGRGSPPPDPPKKKAPRPARPLAAVKGLKDVAEVAAGGEHACARLGDGSVQCWGRNHHGQLGDGTTKDRTAPVKVAGLPPAAQLALGAAHSCALLQDRTVRCWGAGGSKVLGDPTGTDQAQPMEIPGLARVWALSSGADHACAGVKAPAIVCWGDNRHGQLGSGSAGEKPESIVW